MKKTASIFTFILIGILVLSACGQQNPKPELASPIPATPPRVEVSTAISSGTTGEITPEPPASTPTEPAAGEQKIVTLDDRGKTLSMAVGESFLLKLGDVYIWDINVSDQNVLSRAKNITVVAGAQGVYEAHQAGTVTLSATGDPKCRQSKPQCGMPSILFTITVVIK
jgi:hypothetical protein